MNQQRANIVPQQELAGAASDRAAQHFLTLRHAPKAEPHAIFDEPTPLTAFTAIDVPALLMTGATSTASARAVARPLATMLRVRTEEIDGVGRMAPVTHPETVNRLIGRFVEATAPRCAFTGKEAQNAGFY